MTTRDSAIEALVNDPLYQLSVANQRRFHTNMLYWLHTGGFEFSRGLRDVLKTLSTGRIERDWNHIDLYVRGEEMGHGAFALVNRLQSTISNEELEQRWRNLTSNTACEQFVVLSLIPPAQSLPKPWQFVDCAELLWSLSRESGLGADSAEGTSSFEYLLVDRYAHLLKLLIAVRDLYDVRGNTDDRVTMAKSERERLNGAGLLPMIEKVRTAALVRIIRDRIGNGVELVEGLTTGQAIVKWYAVGDSGHRFGWQYESGRVCLAVVLDESSGGPWKGRRVDRERLVQQQFPDFFDFQWALGDFVQLLDRYRGKAGWRGSEPGSVFQYRPLHPDVTYEQLANACVKLTRHADHYVSTHP